MSIRKKAMKRIITFVLLLAMAATLVNPLAEINVKAVQNEMAVNLIRHLMNFSLQ